MKQEKNKNQEELNQTKPNKDYSIDDIKLIYDFEYNALREAALAVSKGMSFYLAITAALVGYVLTQNFNNNIKFIVAIICVLIALFALISCSFIGFGIIKGLDSLKALIKMNNSKLFDETDLTTFIYRGKKAVFATFICSFLVLLVFTVAILSIKKT